MVFSSGDFLEQNYTDSNILNAVNVVSDSGPLPFEVLNRLVFDYLTQVGYHCDEMKHQEPKEEHAERSMHEFFEKLNKLWVDYGGETKVIQRLCDASCQTNVLDFWKRRVPLVSQLEDNGTNEFHGTSTYSYSMIQEKMKMYQEGAMKNNHEDGKSKRISLKMKNYRETPGYIRSQILNERLSKVERSLEVENDVVGSEYESILDRLKHVEERLDALEMQKQKEIRAKRLGKGSSPSHQNELVRKIEELKMILDEKRLERETI